MHGVAGVWIEAVSSVVCPRYLSVFIFVFVFIFILLSSSLESFRLMLFEISSSALHKSAVCMHKSTSLGCARVAGSRITVNSVCDD